MSRSERRLPSRKRFRRRLQFECLEDRRLLDGGLTGQYFDNSDLTNLKLTRVDAQVGFDWGAAAPHSSLGADTFSVRWTGWVEPAFSELYTFFVTSDDGMRLWVDGRLVVSQWTNHSADAAAGQIALVAGGRYDVRLEYYENSGSASVRLEWSSPSQPRQVIPAARLWPDSGIGDGGPVDRGTILQETWTGIPGSSLAALTGNANFPAKPNARDYLLAFESLQTGWGDSYGQRVHGYLVPPVTGSYVLAVAGDERVELYLSSDADPAHAALVASVPSATAVREFSAFPSQQSAAVPLLAGQQYYVEVLHKEDNGADHFSVAWQMPGSSQLTVIPGEVLVPFGTDTALPAQGTILNTLVQSHPRLLVTSERWQWVAEQIAGPGQMQTWYNSLRSSANSILTQALPAYDPDNRGTILGVSRSVVDHVYKLALVYRMTGDTRYAERAWDELNAAAGFPDWHPAHFLDTAEMSHAFAIGYDWLFEYWSAERRTALVSALVSKGLNPGLSVLRSNSGWAASTSNNWNFVCNGGLVLGALAIADQQPALAEELLARAVPSVRAVLRHFTADQGGWYEGPGYWGYSTEYNSRMVAGLVSALGTDFGLSRIAGVAENGYFPLQLLGPSRTAFNFADASAGITRGPQLFWYARRFDQPEYAWYERTYGASSVMGLLWYDSRGSDPGSIVAPTDAHFRGDVSAYATQDVVSLRGSWSDPQTTFVGLKAGRVGDSHGNLDAGSFVLDALGQRWLHDLGGDDYALPGYFGSQRWDYYRMRAEGHNTLVINPGSGADQVVNAKPPVLRQEGNADESLVVADLTTAYSGVSRVWRGWRLSRWDGSLLVQDEIEAATAADVWSFFHVKLDPSQIEIAADGTSALLTTTSGRMWVQLLGSPGARLELRDPVPLPTSPNPDGQSANAGYQKLAIHLPNVTSRRLAVWFVPLPAGREPPLTTPALTSLSAWQLAEDHRVWLGDIDGYMAGDAADDVTVDPAWRTAITTAIGLPSAAFDTVADGQVVSMSFAFTVPAGQQVIGGRLTLGLRGTSGGSGSDRLYLDSAAASSLYSALGWTALTTAATARTLDLGYQLSLLQDGRLDVALSGNSAVDWAELDLRFGPTGQSTVAVVEPEADAYVRSGSYANQNYPTGVLMVKKDSGDYAREAYLRFAVDSVPANVTSATLRLVPTSLAVAAENQLAFVADDSWAETGITWNNKPSADAAFASFAPQVNVPAEFDVTALVAAAVAGDKRLSLRISSSIAGADYWVSFASREHANAQFRPQLRITTLAPAPDPILRIYGDRDWVDQDDTIRLVGEPGYVSVYVNGATVPEVRRDMATLQQILVDGRGARDVLLVDASAGNPIPVGGLGYEGGSGDDTLALAGPADAVFTGGQVAYASSIITLANVEYGSFSTRSLTVDGATLRLGGDAALGSLTDLIVSGGGTLDLNGHATQANRVTLADGAILDGQLTGTVYTLQNGTVSAALGGSGNLTKNTTGKVVLSGANTYTGTTTIYQGILNIRHAQALGAAATAVTISCDGAANRYSALELEGPDFTIAGRPLNTTGSGISGNGAVRNISGHHTWTGPVTLTGGGGGSTYQVDAGTLEFTGPLAPNTTSRSLTLQGSGEGMVAGEISDGGQTTPLTVRKRGSGTWTLSDNNSYTGSTTVEAGTLLVDGALAGGAVSVSSAATLGGTGTLAGTVTINSGGLLAPARDGETGTLTVGSLTLAAGSLLEYDLAGSASDRVVVTGTLTVNGGKFNLAGSGLTPTTHTLIDYTGTLGGSFSNLRLGTRSDGFRFQLVHDLAATSIDLQLSNAAPTISPLADLTTPEDTPAGPMTFTVSDLETPASLLAVSAVSSDPTLVPPENILLSWGEWPPGAMSRSYWTGISGTAVTDLTGAAAFPDNPSGTGELALFESPLNWADNYGQLVRGYVVPPQTGDYTFWIASDDRSELWLSPDDDPARKTKIAQVTNYTSSRQWTKEAGQQSAPVRLEAGRGYYLEAVHKEGTGGDHLAVGWQLPDGTYERPIPGNRLSPFSGTSPRTLTITPAADRFGTTTITVTAVDAGGASSTRSFLLTVTPVDDDTPTLVVTQFAPTGTGFVARFGRVVEPSVLNLYDSASQTLGPADVTVTGATVGPVRGSFVFSADQRQITFVQSGGLLEPDTYTVTLYSGTTRFREPTGGTLDGNADGATGDDYQATFRVSARPAGTVTISLPDMARGAGQSVNIPNAAVGLPVRLSDAAGVRSLAVDLVYDQELLSITSATLASGIPAGWSAGLDTSTPGVAKIWASGTTPLSGTNVDVVRLTAAVPGDAPYGAVQTIGLENVSLNGGTIAAVGDVAVHKAAYLGDADGSGIHSSADGFLTVQAALGLASGFAAHAWTDPLIVGDADGSGVLSAADAFLIGQEGLGLSEPFVPNNPHITVTPVGGGIDPQFQIDVNLVPGAGGRVSVPVKLGIEPAATNVGGLDFDLFFDLAQLTIQLPGGVAAGADTAGWAVSAILVAPGQLRVGMVSSNGQPLVPGLREIARLRFDVEAGESSRTGWQPVPRCGHRSPITDDRLPMTDVLDGSKTHPTLLDIEPVDAGAGGYTWTDVDGSVLIRPAERMLAGATRERVWRDVDAKADLLESVLADLVREIASAWR